ncbi:MAG: OadG family transporter subunit [Brevinema sp.]
MFGDTISLAETGLITLIGLGTVFCVLILLVIVLSLFRFIPSSSPKISTPAVGSINPEEISSLQKAVIIAAVLESLNMDTNQHKVGIRRIQKIS